jgi:hypothetical protein
MNTSPDQTPLPLPRRTRAGKPPSIPDYIVAEIRRRALTETWHGAQKVIALDLGLSFAFVNQVIRGWRRKLK